MSTAVTVHLVRNPAEHAEAKARLHVVMELPDADTHADEIAAQAQLIEDYERTHFPIAAPDAITAIQFRMEQEGLDRGDLAKVLHTERGRVSELMNGKRQFTVRMLCSLYRHWRIPAEVLLASGRTRTYVREKPLKRR